MTGPYQQQPDPFQPAGQPYGPPSGSGFPPGAGFPPGVRPGPPPRDKMVVALVAIVITLIALCLIGAATAVYFLREEPGADDKTAEILQHRPAIGG